MAVLVCLVKDAGGVVERSELLGSVWADAFVTEEVLTHCIWELRKALGDNARKPRFIQTVPRRGYRFLVEPEVVEARAAADDTPSLAVLPFVDLAAGGDNAYFCEGMAEELTHALSRLRGLRVLSRTSALQFRDGQRDLREVGRQLGVDLLLEGSVRPAGDGFRTLARLVEVPTGFDLWAEAYHHDMGDVFRVQHEIVQAIVAKVRGDLISGIEAIGGAPTGDVETYRLHLKARHEALARKPSSLERAVELFGRALERESSYAPALAGLADTLLLQSVYGLEPASERAARGAAAGDGGAGARPGPRRRSNLARLRAGGLRLGLGVGRGKLRRGHGGRPLLCDRAALVGYQLPRAPAALRRGAALRSPGARDGPSVGADPAERRHDLVLRARLRARRVGARRDARAPTRATRLLTCSSGSRESKPVRRTRRPKSSSTRSSVPSAVRSRSPDSPTLAREAEMPHGRQSSSKSSRGATATCRRRSSHRSTPASATPTRAANR